MSRMHLEPMELGFQELGFQNFHCRNLLLENERNKHAQKRDVHLFVEVHRLLIREFILDENKLISIIILFSGENWNIIKIKC